jgi:hypothetical protein
MLRKGGPSTLSYIPVRSARVAQQRRPNHHFGPSELRSYSTATDRRSLEPVVSRFAVRSPCGKKGFLVASPGNILARCTPSDDIGRNEAGFSPEPRALSTAPGLLTGGESVCPLSQDPQVKLHACHVCDSSDGPGGGSCPLWTCCRSASDCRYRCLPSDFPEIIWRTSLITLTDAPPTPSQLFEPHATALGLVTSPAPSCVP